MPATSVNPDIRKQVEDFERLLLEDPELYDTYIGGGPGQFRSVAQAITDKLFNLLGPQGSYRQRRRFGENPFLIQQRGTIKDIEGALAGTTDPFALDAKRGLSGGLFEAVESGTPYIDPSRVRNLFTAFPRALQTDPQVRAQQFLESMNPNDLYSLYSTSYAPTASAFENFRRGQERKDYIGGFDVEAPGQDLREIEGLRALSLGQVINLQKYNQSVSPAFQNIAANYVETVKANNSQYWNEVVGFFDDPNDPDDDPEATANALLGNMTIGQVLNAQARWWLSPKGRAGPNAAKAGEFFQQYGYWPSSVEAISMRPFTAYTTSPWG